MPRTAEIAFTLNGRATRLAVSLEASALTVLREQLDLKGAKLACGEGECGACTIIVDDASLNACLMPAIDLDGRTVLTIEGLWTEAGLDRVQQAFIDKGAVQCGFCTPGMIVQLHHLLARNPAIGEAELRRGIEGNVCRCTGYAKIIEAAIAAARAPARAGGKP
jgi:carbon-monoxide dehydrogenase small subunit